MSKQEMIDTLIAKGYDKEIASTLEYAELVENYEAIKAGKLVGVDTTAVTVDNIETIEDFLASDEKELKKMGATAEEIKATEKSVNELLV